MDGKLSFEQYFNEYYSQVVKYIVKKISNLPDAEDLAMEVFTSCFRKFRDFDPDKASFATWLYVIVNNKIKNYYRDHKIYDELDDTFIDVVNFEDDVIAAQQISFLRKELEIALGELPEHQRKILILKYFKNKNSNEIAVIMDMSAVNVRVNISRAIEKLRKFFNDKNIEWEN